MVVDKTHDKTFCLLFLLTPNNLSHFPCPLPLHACPVQPSQHPFLDNNEEEDSEEEQESEDKDNKELLNNQTAINRGITIAATMTKMRRFRLNNKGGKAG